jgi:hypothetical protein
MCYFVMNRLLHNEISCIGYFKGDLQRYYKRYYVANITKTSTLKDLYTMDGLYVFKCKRFRNTRHTDGIQL